MRHATVSIAAKWAIAAIAVVATVGMGALGVAVPAAQAQAGASPGPRYAACTALGTYLVGPHPLPVRPVAGAAAGAESIAAIVGSTLRGTVIIAAYTGCGQPTSGTFSVQRPTTGSTTRPGSTGGRCSGPCPLPSTGVLKASGTITQNPAHAGDPASVMITGSITGVRAGSPLGRPCSDETGCPRANVISTTIALNDVAGTLRIGEVTDSGVQTATLSFPLPHVAAMGRTPMTMTLHGSRGRGGPSTARLP